MMTETLLVMSFEYLVVLLAALVSFWILSSSAHGMLASLRLHSLRQLTGARGVKGAVPDARHPAETQGSKRTMRQTKRV